MLSELFTNPVSFLFWLAALIVGITVHEFAHALAADRLGDPTPRVQGRLTLDPRAHMDPIGTLMLLVARFGWGKPVQIDRYNLRNPKRDAAIISLAGPMTNFVVAITASILLQILFRFRLPIVSSPLWSISTYIVFGFLQPLIIMNVILGVFNLLPVHPLDGFTIVAGLLPKQYADQWNELAPYGMIFLIFLILPLFGTSPISTIISPIIQTILSILLPSAPVV